MGKLEEGIRDSVRPKNKFESQGEVYKTVVRPAMMYGAETCAVKERTREEVGCGGNENVEMDEWSHQGGQN